MWNSIHYIQFPLGNMSQQSQTSLQYRGSFVRKSCSLSLQLTDRWLLQCNDTRTWGCIPAVGCDRLLSVYFAMLLQLSIDTGYAGPRFLMRWRDLGLMYIHSFGIGFNKIHLCQPKKKTCSAWVHSEQNSQINMNRGCDIMTSYLIELVSWNLIFQAQIKALDLITWYYWNKQNKREL